MTQAKRAWRILSRKIRRERRHRRAKLHYVSKSERKKTRKLIFRAARAQAMDLLNETSTSSAVRNKVDEDAAMATTSSSSSSIAESNKRKRRLSSCSVDNAPSKRPVAKISKSAENNRRPSSSDEFSLMDFSDEVLLEILLHCSSPSLHAMAR